MSHLEIYGGDSGSAIVHRIDDDVRGSLRLLSVSTFLQMLHAEYSGLRDAARFQHGKFNSRRLKRMRDAVLGIAHSTESCPVMAI
ncbi:hypothetical protein [Streptomyces griseoluteus]|uniref:hypothetical protein n=1 Tax=Streptomyces griseoluteus TaxID=29306 RepID=UPI0036FFF7A8